MLTVSTELQPILNGIVQFISYMVLAVFAENVILARALGVTRLMKLVPDHRARQIRAGELGEWDLVLAMTSRHLSVLERLADRAGIEHEGAPASAADLLSVDAPRICLYRDLDPEGSGDVPDPWYGGHQDFLDTLEVIERVTPVIVDLVR